MYRKLLCFLLLTLGAAIAPPGLAAPQKTFLMTVGPTPPAPIYNVDPITGQQILAPGGVPFTYTLKNVSQSGANSNISSFSFTAAGLTIFSVDLTSCQATGAKCAFDAASNTVTVTNISSPVQAQGVFTVNLAVSSCGDGLWNTKAYTGSQLNGTLFGGNKNVATNVRCGDVNCNESFVVPNADNPLPGSPTYFNGIRGKYEKDGTVCSADNGDVVDFFVTNTIPTNNTLHFEWQTSTTAAFRYTLSFATAGLPQVSWLSDNLGPVFIAGQPCLATNASFNNNLPAPYGVLTQAASKTDTHLKVDTSLYAASNPILPTSFPIVIGTERLLVTSATNGNWTVMRHQGGTNAAPYGVGAVVTSTPLPLIQSASLSADPLELQRQLAAGYAAGNHAQVCVAAPDPNVTPWPVTTYDIIDIGDSYVKGKI